MAPLKKSLPNQPPPPEDVEESSSSSSSEEEEEEEEEEGEGEEEESSEEEYDGEEEKQKPNSPQNQTFQGMKKADIVEKQVSSLTPSVPQSQNQASQVNKKLKFGEKQTVPLLQSALDNEESEDGSEEEDLEDSLASPSASDFTIKAISPKKPTAKDTKPTSKRPSETAIRDEKTPKGKKKAKISEEDSKKEKPSGGFVGRVCSEEDEVRILQGLIDYQVQKGAGPSADMGAFYLFVNEKLKAEITKTQLYEKVRRLKKKYFKNAERVGKGEDVVFSKSHEVESFDLSKRIWGDGLISNGGNEIVIGNCKSDGQKVKKVSKVESLDASPKHEGKDVENTCDFEKKYPFTVQAYNSMAGLMTAEQVSFMKENLCMVESETSKEFEEKWKELQVKETKLLLKKFELFADHTRRVLDAMKK